MTEINVKRRKINPVYGYRTDLPAKIYQGKPFTHVEWVMDGGKAIRIPIDQLRHALAGAPTRAGMGVRILFTIDPAAKTVRPDGSGPAVAVPGLEVL